MDSDGPTTEWVLLDEDGDPIEGERYESKEAALVARTRYDPTRLIDIEECAEEMSYPDA